jgi:Phage late-transcription coactivator
MPTKDEMTTFSLSIETIVAKKKIPYMDAILMYCEETGLEVELAAKLVSGALKSKIQIEAEELNFLPKSNTTKLPF